LGAPGLWEVSRQAVVGRRCRELGRAQALLARAPEQARDRAAALLVEAPDFKEARVLHGRASLRAGDAETALTELTPLLADDAAPLADPAALLDGGRAALARGDLSRAARFYRALGSRAALLADRKQQAVAYIEIAGALMASDLAPLDDVLAYLREARRRSAGSGLTGLCAALTAVAWAAQGREAEAQGALGELTDVDALARLESEKAVSLADGLLHAALGLAVERTHPEQSAKHYQQLADGPLGKTSLGKLATRDRGRAGGKAEPKRGRR
jgi:hypothetical protein